MAKGNLELRQIKLGDNADTSKNFVISVPAVADGTLVIERGNGTDVLSIDASGKVTMPGNVVPAFRAYASGTTSVSSTSTKIQLASEDFDTAGAFNTTTSRFTPTVAGYYSFAASCAYATASSVVQCRLVKNGTAASIGGSGAAAAQATVSDLVYMNGTTDYIELFGYSATTQNTVAGTTATYLSGFLARAA